MKINFGLMIVVGLVSGCAARQPVALQGAEDLKVASVELSSGNPEAALDVARKVLADRPRDPLALVLAGNAQAALGQQDLAQASFHEALDASPGLLDASLGLARLKLAGDAAGSAADLRALLRRRPDDARLWTDLGVAYDLQSMPRQAQDAYRHAIRQDQSMISAQADLGLSLALSGQAQEAIALLAPLATRAPSTPRIRADLAVAEAMAGNADAAQTVLRQDLPADKVDAAMVGFADLRDDQPPPAALRR